MTWLGLQTGDVFLTASDSWLGRSIRFFERDPGEAPSLVNHAGMILSGDDYVPCLHPNRHTHGCPVVIPTAVSIEALWKVRRGYLRDYYGPAGGEGRPACAIYRDRTLTNDDRARLYEAGRSYAGRSYGPLKLVLHAGDWGLTRLLRRPNVHAFRRLARLDCYPICSWLVAQAYAKTGRNFGCDPGAASPDDLHDWILRHPEKWEEIHPLQQLAEGA